MSDVAAYFQSTDPSDDGSDDDAIMRRARMRFEWCEQWEANARTNFRRDIKFGTADAYNMYQWDDNVRAIREPINKPMLTINKTQVHCRQIVNDARQNRSDIEVRPVGDEATEEAAQIYEGIIRHINYQSDSQAAYDTATWFGVFGGWGYVRVHVDFVDEDTFDQDIFIKRVPNPLMIYLDPMCEHFDCSDARFAFSFTDEDRRKAEDEYGKLPASGDLFNIPPSNNADPWNSKENVRICEYFERGMKSDTLLLLADGTTVRKSALKGTGVTVADLKRSGNLVRMREVSEPEVMWYLIVGNKIIDRKPWAGKYIPIARMVGEENVIDGQLDRKGHVRNLLDPQRMYNYNSSGSVEFIGGQTKTPWIVDIQAISGYETVWNQANTQTTPYLPYNGMDADGNTVPEPKRIDPPAVASAHVEGMKVAQEEMMMASGQYQAVLGAPSNETSGKAINARQRQGENATYHFIDHQASMIRHVGRICLDLIPKVYDTKRVLQVLGQDQELTKVMVDPEAPAAAITAPKPDDGGKYSPDQIAAVLNPKVGKYDLIADIGPNYATQRQEAFNAFSQIMAQQKEAFTIVGDLWAKAADFPGSDALADRLKNMVPQQALGGPSPEMKQLIGHMQQAAQAGQQQIEMLHQELTKVMVDPEAPAAAISAPKPDDGGKYSPDQIAAVLNPKVGKYDLIADIGPNYATQRQEAFNAFSQIMAQQKEAFTIVGDLWAKAADFPGSDALADRLKNMVPQQALGGPSPEMKQLIGHMQQAAQAGQQQIEMLHQELQASKKKLDDQSEDLRRKDYEAETNRLKAVGGIDPMALKPIIRQLVSEVLATPIVPVMQAHAAVDQSMLPPDPTPSAGQEP